MLILIVLAISYASSVMPLSPFLAVLVMDLTRGTTVSTVHQTTFTILGMACLRIVTEFVMETVMKILIVLAISYASSVKSSSPFLAVLVLEEKVGIIVLTVHHTTFGILGITLRMVVTDFAKVTVMKMLIVRRISFAKSVMV